MAERKAAAANPPAAAGAPTKMSAVRSGIARGELAILPVYGEVWIEVLGQEAMAQIEAATIGHMTTAIGLPFVPLHAGSYNLQRFARVLHAAVRDPDDPTHRTSFGSLSDWQDEPEAVLAACIEKYMEVKSRLDPTSAPNISDEEVEAVLDAFKKKDWTLLRSFARDTLASFLLTGAVQPSSSPSPASKNSAPSAE